MFKRYKKYRTAILAVVATMTLVTSAVYSFDVPWSDIGGYFFAATVLLILIMIPAAATAGLMHWRRKKRYDAAVKGLAELEKQKATAVENKVDSESAP